MADKSAIEWTDATFNGWIGCTKVSPACDNCYASVSTPARSLGIIWGAGAPRRRTSSANWHLPMKWNELAGKGQFVQCGACGLREFRKWDKAVPPGGLACCSTPECTALPESESAPVRPRVFCSSLADVFDNEVDPQWRTDLFDLIRATPNLDWLLLTKRIGNAKNMLGASIERLWPDNVWIGATICNQAEADRDIPKLLAIPARVRFLSIEPLLGPIELPRVDFHCDVCGGTGILGRFPTGNCTRCTRGSIPSISTDPKYGTPSTPMRSIDWVIVGGESGPNARPMHPEWVTALRDQCAEAGVPFLFKQWGEWVPRSSCYHTFADGKSCGDYDPTCERWPVIRLTYLGHDGRQLGSDTSGGSEAYMQRVGKKIAGRLLDGEQHDGYPEARP